ncbi:MAG: glycosyltransferase family 39 protein [Candidatus Flexifilum sp.]
MRRIGAVLSDLGARPRVVLAGIVGAALIARLALIAFVVEFPGVADPNHYYNMALNVAAGRGFVIDYIWQYSRPPAAITHPEDHWMPLTSAIAALPLMLGGSGVDAALLGFAAIGALVPLISYALARQIGLKPGTSLIAAAFSAALPEFVLNSVRTDTTIAAAALVGLCLFAFNRGLRSGRIAWYGLAGAAAGLTYLTRSDGALLLPMMFAGAVVDALAGRGDGRMRARAVGLIAALAAFVVTVLPWLIRNLTTFGALGSAETDDMFFFTDHLDHYAYGRAFTLSTLLEAQTWGQIIGKRLFELAAGGQMMIATSDALSAPLIGGTILLLVRAARRDADARAHLLGLAPALILALGVTVAYAVFIPYKAQAGSLKKGWLMALPALLPIAAYALQAVIADRRLRFGAAAVIAALLSLNAFQLVRTDQRAALAYLADIERVAAAARALPDTNGDGEIILMTQDPYILAYVGLRTIMYPSEPLTVIHEVARRYGVDYLLMPAARPALDPLYLRQAAADSFVFVGDLPGTQYEFWRVQ